jgi:transposase
MGPLIREVVMGKARSEDLRQRVVEAVAAGASRRQAAGRFQVGVSSAIRWVAMFKQTGVVSPRPRGGKPRSPLEPHADWLLALVAAEPDLTLAEIVERLAAELEVKVTEISVRRFFKRHRISFKKNSARRRAGPAGRGREARGLEGRPGPA